MLLPRLSQPTAVAIDPWGLDSFLTFPPPLPALSFQNTGVSGGRRRRARWAGGGVLAWFREVGVRIGASRRRRVKVVRVMDWWHKMLFPVRRAWLAVAARVRARKNGGGLLKLHNDVQTCGYEDVQVMWEMLRRSEKELAQTPKRKRPVWRFLFWRPNANRRTALAHAQ